MAVASLVLGIISCVFACIPAYTWFVGIILGIIGIILGAVALKKQPEKKGLATAGLVLSIIAVALSFALYLACAACVAATASLPLA